MLEYRLRECGQGDELGLSLIAQATILETYAELVRGANLYRYIDEELRAERFRACLQDPSMRLWAAELEPTHCIAGYAHALPDADDRSAMELKRLYLLGRFRGRGIGKRLMDESVMFARSRGSQSMLLRVHHRNDAAIRFYKTYGFQIIGDEPFPAGEEISTVLVMRYTLEM